MANRERGEIEVVVNDKPYTLRLSTNAICELQARTKKTYGDLINAVAGMDILAMRDMVWSALKPYHANEFKSGESVGQWMDDVGGIAGTAQTMKELLVLNSPKKVQGNGNPTQDGEAASGTGDSSTGEPGPLA